MCPNCSKRFQQVGTLLGLQRLDPLQTFTFQDQHRHTSVTYTLPQRAIQKQPHSVWSAVPHHAVWLQVTGSDDKTWKMWHLPKGDLIMSGEGHTDWVAGVAFHPKVMGSLKMLTSQGYLHDFARYSTSTQATGTQANTFPTALPCPLLDPNSTPLRVKPYPNCIPTVSILR